MGGTDWKAEGPAHIRYIYSFVLVSPFVQHCDTFKLLLL